MGPPASPARPDSTPSSSLASCGSATPTPRPSTRRRASHARCVCAATSASTTPAPCSPASCWRASTTCRTACAATRGDRMDPNRLTEKSQEAVHDAQTKALRFGHTEVDAEHLLLALLDQPDGLVPRLLARAEVDVDALRQGLEQYLEGRPRVSGPGAAPGQVYVSRALNQLLDAAEQEAQRLKDEYVSVEHVLLAMIASGPQTAAGRILREHGVTRERFLEVLTEVRGSQRVTSANPEVAYEALEKYGRDLVTEARVGRMDPVIGRDAEIRRVVQILSRKTKNNPVLVGDPGVGKT